MYDRVSRFVDEFRARHGALRCRELTGCELCTIEGQASFKARDLHHRLCSKLVASAVEMVQRQQD
jgi:hypothetical protein